MTTAVFLVEVLEGGARVQQHMVVDVLDVARLEQGREMELVAARQAVQQGQGLLLDRGQARHIGEALRRDDVRAHVAAGELALVDIENGLQVVGRAARLLLSLPTPGEGLVQHLEQVGAAPGDFVVNRHRAADHAQATRLGGAQHEQAHHVTGVGVVGQLLVGGVAAAAGAVEVHIHIAHIAQDVAVAALGDGGAHVLADAPVNQAQFGFGVLLHRKAAQQEQAEAVLEHLARVIEHAVQGRQRKVLLFEVGHALATQLRLGQCGLNFLDLGARKGMHPLRGALHDLCGLPVGGDVDRLVHGVLCCWGDQSAVVPVERITPPQRAFSSRLKRAASAGVLMIRSRTSRPLMSRAASGRLSASEMAA